MEVSVPEAGAMNGAMDAVNGHAPEAERTCEDHPEREPEVAQVDGYIFVIVRPFFLFFLLCF